MGMADRRPHQQEAGPLPVIRYFAHHPIQLILLLLLAVGVIGAYPWLLIPALLAPAAWYGTQAYDRRYQAHATHRRRLEARADFEHHLLINGDPRGTYGQYRPHI